MSEAGKNVMPNASREGYLLESFRYFHLRDTAGQERSFHFHEFDKLVVHLSGRVEYSVESESYPMRPWDILLIGHHTIHRAQIDTSEPYERVILYLDRRYFGRAGSDMPLMGCFASADAQSRHRLTPDEAQRAELAALLGRLEAAAADVELGAQALRETLVVQLLVYINRLALDRDPARRSAVGAPADEKITQVLSYINENLARELTVEELSERAYLSKYHFMRLFKAQTGATVHAYVRQKRLLRAAKLIRGGTPVGKAAEACGFSDYSAFYRAFRACFGASPRDIFTKS